MNRKRVAIISNYARQKNNSKLIDECDEVVRFSFCAGVGHNAGSKTTIWVTRTYYWFTREVAIRWNQQMKRCVQNCHTAYIAYGYPEHDKLGHVTGDELLRYDDRVVSDLCTCHTGIRCVPIDAQRIAELHPNRHPSNGIIFLSAVVQEQLFPDCEIFLCGFTFANMPDVHGPQWEREQVNQWVSAGYFQQV
jgi:hypothetical protein